jgi:hypothetical protein
MAPVTPVTRDTVSRKTKKQATRAARQGGYKDANFDFIPDKDKLSRDELAAQYQSAVGIIYTVPELQTLFEQALDQEWTPARMQAAIQNSEWYRNNDEYARVAWAQEQAGGADWQTNLATARSAVQIAAAQMGADVTDEELNALAKRYVYEGWGESTRKGMLASALSSEITFLKDARGVANMRGAAGNLVDDLRNMARANGVSYTDNWYESAARSVASGLSSATDWERDVREQAASLFPVYSDKIRQGMNVYDLASPYINTMAQEFEIDPNQITLNDHYIRSALGGMSPDGNFTPMGLWDFQKKLRQDPRWENTSKAQNEVTSVTGRVMQMFGLMGG